MTSERKILDESIRSGISTLLDLLTIQRVHSCFRLVMLTHDDKTTSPGSVVHSRQDDGMRYGTETRKDLRKFGSCSKSMIERGMVTGDVLCEVERQSKHV